jgi:hypothetical protein
MIVVAIALASQGREAPAKPGKPLDWREKSRRRSAIEAMLPSMLHQLK